MLKIKWMSIRDRYWQDLIPIEWFESDCGPTDGEHSVQHIDGGPMATARCQYSVNKNFIKIDYGGEHKNFNNEMEWDIGILKIVFEDSTRSSVGWVEWCDPPGRFRRRSVMIEFLDDDQDFGGGVLGGVEGNLNLRNHLVRERNANLRRQLIELFRRDNRPLKCEVCEFDYSERYGEIGEGYCEVHHVIPLSSGPRRVTTEDLAVLCANCHRMIHRAGCPPIDEFRKKYLIEPIGHPNVRRGS